jgi:NDP-sugar pyrophosphorylase family protein
VILGTSGALDNARELLEGETIVVVNGKIITDIDLNAALETHRRTDAIATLVLLPNPNYQRFTIVETADGLLKGFGSMPIQSEYVGREVPLMFTGIQILEPRIFDYIPPRVFSHSTSDVYPQAIAKGERIATHVATGKWYELSTPQRYLDISLAMLAERGEHVAVGSGCVISERADVGQSVLWDGVVIEPDALIKRAVLGDGVRITAGEIIEDAVVVRNSLVNGKTSPPKALKGVVRGHNFVVSLSQ